MTMIHLTFKCIFLLSQNLCKIGAIILLCKKGQNQERQTNCKAKSYYGYKLMDNLNQT